MDNNSIHSFILDRLRKIMLEMYAVNPSTYKIPARECLYGSVTISIIISYVYFPHLDRKRLLFARWTKRKCHFLSRGMKENRILFSGGTKVRPELHFWRLHIREHFTNTFGMLSKRILFSNVLWITWEFLCSLCVV